MDEKEMQVKKPPQVTMRGPGGGMAPGEKPKSLSAALGKLIRYMGRAKYAVLVSMLFAMGGTVFQVLGPKVMGTATTTLAEGLMAKIQGTGGIDFDKIWSILMLTLLLYLIGSVLGMIQAQIMAVVTQNLGYRMRREISEKINRMPMKYFESRPYGEVLSRITNDVDTFTQSLSQSVSMIITSVTIVLGTFIMMLTISPEMTLVALVILPVSGGLVGLLVKVSQKHFRLQQEYHIPFQFVSVLCQYSGSSEHCCCVNIMAARMHHTSDFRCELCPCHLGQRKSIHICSERSRPEKPYGIIP